MSLLISQAIGFAVKYIWRPLQGSVELFATLFYHDMLKRITTEPLKELGREDDPDKLGSHFREWSRMKSNESKYIQIAV